MSETTGGMRIRNLGLCMYEDTLQKMRQLTDTRDMRTRDECWLLEHFPVFTQGLSCKLIPHHNPQGIPVVKTDRGGQITYHGPGQLVAYLMIDLKRSRLGVRHVVNRIEQVIIDTLAVFDIPGQRQQGAPGVYVDGLKIAALGLRVRKGSTYHGLSINVDADLTPFDWIDPCGYPGLKVVNLSDLAQGVTMASVMSELQNKLSKIME